MRRTTTTTTTASSCAPSGAAVAASRRESPRHDRGAIKSEISKLLTREMLKTKREGVPLSDDFQEVKQAVEDGWAVEYGPTVRLQRAILDGGAYAEVSLQTEDLVQELVPEEIDEQQEDAKQIDQQEEDAGQQRKEQIKIDRSRDADEGIITAMYTPAPDPPAEKEEGSSRISGGSVQNKKKKLVQRVLGTEFKVRITRGADAMVLECGMMHDGSSDVQVYHVNFEFGGSGDASATAAATAAAPAPAAGGGEDAYNQLAISHKFKHSEEMCDALQEFLAEECGIDDSLGEFMINYNVFRIRRSKLQFLQGVKSMLG